MNGRPRAPPLRVQCAAAVGVDASVGGVAQHVGQRDPARPPPGQLSAFGPLVWPHPQLDAGIGQEGQHRPDRAQPLEGVEDQPDDRLHLLVGIQNHLTGGTADESDRQRHRQLPAPGLGDPPGPHPLLDQVQLGLADRALQAQQQAVVVLGRVIDPVQIAQQRPGQGAQLQQLMPLPARPGQPGHLDAPHDAHVVQPHLRHQTGEPGPDLNPGGRMPQILVDHQHPRPGPTQRDRPLDQPVLPPRGLAVILHLGRGGLAHVDGRQPITVPRLDLARGPLPRQPHRSAHRRHPHPDRTPPSAPSARSTRSTSARRAPCSPPGTPPTAARSPTLPGSGGQRSICGHRPPPGSATIWACCSRLATATTANRPSSPMTGTFSALVPSTYAVWLAS